MEPRHGYVGSSKYWDNRVDVTKLPIPVVCLGRKVSKRGLRSEIIGVQERRLVPNGVPRRNRSGDSRVGGDAHPRSTMHAPWPARRGFLHRLTAGHPELDPAEARPGGGSLRSGGVT